MHYYYSIKIEACSSCSINGVNRVVPLQVSVFVVITVGLHEKIKIVIFFHGYIESMLRCLSNLPTVAFSRSNVSQMYGCKEHLYLCLNALDIYWLNEFCYCYCFSSLIGITLISCPTKWIKKSIDWSLKNGNLNFIL